ncbi:MAG: hypothetical protein QG670_1269 [Thermoproteota archaeon]|nr:hypothetical protein [Thermoproteota archaeon]
MVERITKLLYLDKRIRILLFTSLETSLGTGLWFPLLGIYITGDLGVSILLFGFMTTIGQLVQSLVVFPSGFLSDNFGRKSMIILSIIFSILAVITLLFVKNLPWLIFISTFHGLSIALMEPSRSAYIIDVTSQERVGTAYATLAIFQSFSSIITTSLAGVIAGILGFYWLFIIALVVESSSLLIASFYLKESLDKGNIKTRNSKESLSGQLRNSLNILRNPPLFAVLFSIVFHQLGLGIANPYLTLYTRDVLAFSLPTISLILGLQQSGIFLGQFPSGRIVDKYGGEISFAFHIFITTPVMILLIKTGNPSFIGFILFAWGLTFGLDNVSRIKLIPKYRQNSGTATAFGLISLIAGVVSLISPTIGGWVWINFSPETVFYVSAVTNFLGSIPLFILWVYDKHK